MEADINQEVDPARDLMEPLWRVFELNKANIVAFTLCDEDRGIHQQQPGTEEQSSRYKT